MTIRKTFTLAGIIAASSALALAPLLPAAAATDDVAWGSWGAVGPSSLSAETVTFTGTNFVNGTWAVTGAAGYEILDTTTAGEYFTAETPIGTAFSANGPDLGANFLKVTMPAGGQSTLTVTFDAAVPADQLGIAVSDIDTDHVSISGTDANDGALTGAQINGSATTQGFNFCAVTDPPSACGGDTDTPSLSTGATDVTATGTSAGTDGSSAWFRPNTTVKSLSFTFFNDDSGNTSSERVWLVQKYTPAPLPNTGVNGGLVAGIAGLSIALIAAGGLIVARRRA